MARKPSALASIFDDKPSPEPAPVVTELIPEPQPAAAPRRSQRTADALAAPARRSSHPGKKPMLIHIPRDMHRALRQLSVRRAGSR